MEKTLDSLFVDFVEGKLASEDINLLNELFQNKVLTTEERKRLKPEDFCGPGKSYPVISKAHAVAALARVKQFGNPELQKKVKACVCKKYPTLPSCAMEDMLIAWTDEEIQLFTSKISHPEFGFELTNGQYFFDVPVLLNKEQIDSLPDSCFLFSRAIPLLTKYHNEAALELVSSYKGSIDMAEVIQKLEDSLSENEVEEEQTKMENSCLLTALSNDELKVLWFDMLMELRSRSMEVDLGNKDLEKKHEEALKELEDQLTLSKEENQILSSQCTASDEQNVLLNTALCEVKKELAVVKSLIVDKDKEKEEIVNSLSSLGMEDLDKLINSLDIENELNVLRSGLTKEEVGEVQKTEVEEEKKKYSDQEVSLFKKLVLFKNSNENMAVKHLNELKEFNKINQDLTLDEICEIVSKMN